jgi:hypothetical protein
VTLAKRLADIRICIVLIAVFVTGFVPQPLHAETLSDQLSSATKMYFDGQIEAAIQVLKPLADQAVSAAPSPQGKTALEYLLDTCVGAWDFGCVNEYWPKYARLVNSLPDVPDQLKLPFSLQISYYAGVAAWLSGNRSWAEEWMKQWPESAPEAPWAPRDYIRRQLIRAKLYLILEQHDAASLCVDRALASIVAMDNAESSLREVSVWLLDAVGDLLALGDTERAIGLTLTAARTGQNIFPPNSVEFFRALRTAAAAYEAAGMIAQAKDAIERALVVLSKVHLNLNVQNFSSADSETFAALICALSNDFPGARKHLDEHPLHAMLSDIRARGVIQTLPEAAYFATRALVNVGPGALPNGEDLPLLTVPIKMQFPLPLDLTERATMYQRIGHAIATKSVDRGGSDSELRALAPELLRLESKSTDVVGFLPRRGLIDQLILALATNAFRGEQLDAKSGDTLVRLLDVAARNGQTYSSEALALVATAHNDEVRTDIRDLLRLRSRRESAERVDIARLLSAKPTPNSDGKVVQPTVSFKRRNVYSDYGVLIRQIAKRLRVDQPDLVAADAPPSLEQIQSSLREHEVVVAAPFLFGNVMGHLCIGRTVVRFDTSVEDPAQLSREIRLLEASLTSQNEPSLELDRQYPVTAARHLYVTFLAPAAGCFQPGDSIVWAGSGPDSIPLAALLSDGTAGELSSRPLADWPWVAKDAAVSQVATLSTLVALRRQSSALVGDRKPDFLGIGDPSFAGSTNSDHAAAQFAMRGAVGLEKLSALPQLPDTRTEISETAALFGSRQKQLLGDHATEGDFRRLPLERFTYIEFATHGLVRQDVAGLTEAALALTPTGTSDSFNDGLLTASEIADLPLNARFVALSACNTGLVDFTKFASEVPGLSAAFQVAGVPATLGTLWPVESDASKRIVEETFRGLVDDRVGPGLALAHSQRKYLANSPSIAHQHPRFWAPFVVFGDGTTPSEGHAVRESAQIGEVRVLTSTGGEVSSVTEGKPGELLLRGMGNIRIAIRHSGLTMKLRKDLGEMWAKEDPLVADARVALRMDGGWVLGGYRGGGVIPTVATIQLVDEDAKLRQEWEVARPNVDTSPFTALRIGPDAFLVAIVLHVRNADPKLPWPPDRLLIAEVRVGQPLRVRTEFEIIMRPNFVGLESLGDNLLVVVSTLSRDTLPKSHMDEFQQLTSCGLEGHSSLTLLKHDTFSRIWEHQLDDIQIAKSLTARNGSVRLVGSVRLGCGDGTRIGLWEVNRDRTLKNLFTDQNPRDSQGRGVFEKSDGSLLLIGMTNRATDVDSFEERDPQNVVSNAGRTWVSFSTRRINDAVLITLDPSLQMRSRETLRAGSDLWVTGAVAVGRDIWLYGALGNQAALMQVTHN